MNETVIHFQDVVLLVGLSGTLIGSGIAWGRVLILLKELKEDITRVETDVDKNRTTLRNGGGGVLDRLIRIEEEIRHAPCRKPGYNPLTDDHVRNIANEVVVHYHKDIRDDHR